MMKWLLLIIGFTACVGALALIMITKVAEPSSIKPALPIHEIGMWLIGFHVEKKTPSRQWVAHHFCHQLRPDLMQCILYDQNTLHAKMTGIEYIIPMEAFQRLSKEEQQYWHPHNFEILSGQLTVPAASNELTVLADKMNSYGKAFHMWNAGVFEQEDERYPIGEPRLGWSFNHVHEPKLGMIEHTYDPMDISVEQKKDERTTLISKAKPQCGVKAMAHKFKGTSQPLDGVKAKKDC